MGRWVLHARMQHGLSQKELSTRTGISQSQLSKIERGERDLSFRDLVALATRVGLPLQFFLDGRLTPLRGAQGLEQELTAYGIDDLQFANAVRPVGAFRPVEEVLCQVLVGSPHPRIVEALPILPLRNAVRHEILIGLARRFRVLRSAAFVCDVAVHLLKHASWPSPSSVELDEVEVDQFLQKARHLLTASPRLQEATSGGASRLERKWKVDFGVTLAEYQARCVALAEEGVR